MRQVAVIAVLLGTLTAVGVAGFHFIEGLDWEESLYMAVITLTTVGAYDEQPSDAGKLFIVGYLVCGLGVASYSLFAVGQKVLTTEFRAMYDRGMMRMEIEDYADHYIVCGLGRMGEEVCRYLAERNRKFVVIDTDEEKLKSLCNRCGWAWVAGDASDDAVLTEARVEHARSLTTALPTDADNVYVVLTARPLNGEMQIVARATEDRAISKLERAGADRVVSPLTSGAVKMARFMLNPDVEDFLEIADAQENDLELADVKVDADNPLVGQLLKDTDLRERGLMVIGIRRADGARLMPPPGDAEIRAGDCLFTFGRVRSVNDLARES